MTTFAHLELLYNQFFNLTDEIISKIENEDYNSAIEKLESRDELVKKLFLTKKTVDFTAEEKQKTELAEQKIRESEQENIAHLEKLRDAVGLELRGIKSKVKINNAYDGVSQENEGFMLDISE